jgi:hypothetical protein
LFGDSLLCVRSFVVRGVPAVSREKKKKKKKKKKKLVAGALH